MIRRQKTEGRTELIDYEEIDEQSVETPAPEDESQQKPDDEREQSMLFRWSEWAKAIDL